ncbi:hypothetical protein GQ43DRAFT_260031 [Delitschia confertaspora ATCC 74209]|uniref:Uncharacterized protein n=1 Tax=Delitschia confertaspora ATCC 74209 TaxID=1513339 RepID=A0A9P4MXR2_9PLEO|nr:hypothetical protein GQ43DRAFT_260031 [Delitschia confertaspora ATCC 74209]
MIGQSKHLAGVIFWPGSAGFFLCVCKYKFGMQNSDPGYQTEHHGKTVPWRNELVVGLTRGLMACQILWIGFINFYTYLNQTHDDPYFSGWLNRFAWSTKRRLVG